MEVSLSLSVQWNKALQQTGRLQENFIAQLRHHCQQNHHSLGLLANVAGPVHMASQLMK
jgi:hypothetical protein